MDEVGGRWSMVDGDGISRANPARCTVLGHAHLHAIAHVFGVGTCWPPARPRADTLVGMIRVLLLDDDAPFRSALARALRHAGMVVEAHATLESFLKAARAHRHDILLIDWNLRTSLGTWACESLRAEGETRPIAIISASLEIEFARAQAKKAGASDFIDKTSSPEEWRRRIATLAESPRQRTWSAGSGVHLLDGVNAAASVELRDGAAILRGFRVALRPLEHDLLEHLLAHAGAVVSSEALIAAVWKEPPARTPEGLAAQRDRVVSTMSRLRKALGEAAEMIETVHGGYRIRSAGARAQGT